MAVGWRDIAFQPGKALAGAICENWRWLTKRGDLEPFLCSMLGDVFASDGTGRIHWLCCSAGDVRQVAASRAEFDAICARNGAEVDEWFGPKLIAQLHEAGKIAGPGEAYMFLTLPIFAECRFEPSNLKVMPVNAIFIALADLHQLYVGIPGGSSIRHRIVD
jgi:hypothetical protein